MEKIIMKYIQNEDSTGYIESIEINGNILSKFNGEYIDLAPLVPYIGKQLEVHRYIENVDKPQISIHTITALREREYPNRIGLELYYD